ncbi:probable protein phosphatase 2C 6 [Acyrthosiphon pisum]|uniref:protein-serine/threonine phosphatase n=1 Tax=Acyrthosiphon pisum TaxID=7029 RepID=A0A8R1W0D6_ACYPI|nr:probable protein phosphatase 2C 6 [Acyrthosiphon pisum]|eukprot:XP_001943328.1 PREDICTED: probable protein phosphatase 2C 6 [Acyrthosiphon pisum]
MGTYLSKPITDKESEDTSNGWLSCGSSSMQGWRESQEDAHNCLLDFDKRVALFAVYDGHGGAEVAQYAAEKLPSLVKNTLYDNQDYEKALIKAFMDFDDSLIETPVVEQLTALREDIIEECADEDDEREELSELYEEAKMPIEDIIMKYKNKILENMDQNKESAISKESEDEPSSSKESPISKPKSIVESNDACGSSSSSSSKTVTDDDKKNVGNGVDECKPEDPTTESSPSAKVNGTPNDDDEENGKTEELVAESSEAECGPSSSNGQNGTENNSGTASLILEDSEDSTDEEGEEFGSSMKLDDESDDSDSDDDDDDGTPANSFMYGDEEDEDKPGKDSGCTAVVALLVNNKLYVANAGDSRCVVSVDGKAHDMSKDHKPEDELELQRICKAGGRVSSDGRVNGGLNLSRALGDHNYKKNKDLPNTEQMITALPDVTVLDVTPDNNNFIVLACDGIWNSLSSQEVVDFVLERINKPDVSLSSICEELFELCLAPNTLSDGTGCDNMTCIIVKLNTNQKRSRSDDEEDDLECGESKKHKSDSTEPESVH